MNIQNFGGGLFGREFKSNCESWCFSGKSKDLLKTQFIDFNHNSIDFIRQIISHFSRFFDKLFHFIQIFRKMERFFVWFFQSTFDWNYIGLLIFDREYYFYWFLFFFHSLSFQSKKIYRIWNYRKFYFEFFFKLTPES